MAKSIIIVGAGIAGLSAGCYAQANGFETTIYEMHSIPGGLCTAWKKKGYKFDISMHMLTGSVSGPFHQMWKELGVIGTTGFHYHKETMQIEGMGKKLVFTTDRKKLEADMLAISPDDSAKIKEFIKLIFGPDMMNAVSLKPAKFQNVFDKLKVLPAILPLLGTFSKFGKYTLQDFASGFKDPFLQESVRMYIDAPGWPMLRFPAVALAGFVRSGITEAGAPVGGSQKVVFHIADRFKKLGGEIHYNKTVTDVIIENEKAVGVRFEDGTEKRADYIIWAADGHTLIFDILKEKYIDEKIRKIYSEWIPVKPIVHVMLGVNRDMTDELNRLILEVDEPLNIGGKEYRWITVARRYYDKSMAPEGKSAVEVWYDTEYDFWEGISKNKEAYEAEKNRIAEYTIRQLEKRWPGFASQVEMVDVPTPMTYKRYTGNWKGSPDGWYVTPENMREMDPLRALPGLNGLFMVGQWTAPFTGTVMAALTGRQAVNVLCKNEGKKFSARKMN